MLTLFKGLSLLAQVGVVVGAIAAVFAVYKLWELKNYNEGRARERAVIERQNQEAIGDAQKNSSVRATCVDAFGVDAWDVTRGVCNQ